MAGPNSDLRNLLEPEGEIYVPVMVLDTLVVDARILPHPAGCALVMSCANGIQHRYPMDWAGLQTFRKMVASASISGRANGVDTRE